jgi:V-type H+-transporting ATPase subunit C
VDWTIARLTRRSLQEINSIDNDIRSKYNQYNSIRTNLQTLTRQKQGNLSTKSLLSIVNPNLLVQSHDSEHLETHLVAVPKSNVKEFMRSYETLSPMVVPRSAQFIASDDEYTLYTTTTFKKHSQDFLHKVRERKWIPRDYKYKEGGKEDEEKELKKVEAEEKRVWGETLRLGRTGWSEAVMALVHVLILRVFVETVLRYGLPLDFVGVLVRVSDAIEMYVQRC